MKGCGKDKSHTGMQFLLMFVEKERSESCGNDGRFSMRIMRALASQGAGSSSESDPKNDAVEYMQTERFWKRMPVFKGRLPSEDIVSKEVQPRFLHY